MASNRVIQQTETTQRKIQSSAFVIAASVCVLFSICFAVSSFWGQGQSCKIELESRISPNNAPPASLIRLPGIGVSRAGAIVTYRRNFAAQNGDRPAFQTIDDLQKIRGVGPKTAENVSEWLKFE